MFYNLLYFIFRYKDKGYMRFKILTFLWKACCVLFIFLSEGPNNGKVFKPHSIQVFFSHLNKMLGFEN